MILTMKPIVGYVSPTMGFVVLRQKLVISIVWIPSKLNTTVGGIKIGLISESLCERKKCQTR